ncbi:hypothetical protein E2C01_011800 [Portunus trituberculatus]|uniref:Uncharacterized protein n=1 Tax=Portunus trituberculatus TaxID=210409 RepID=A0A5B7DBY8_PORTR|nr:hypothetical protein [Portunus trituberculatus]
MASVCTCLFTHARVTPWLESHHVHLSLTWLSLTQVGCCGGYSASDYTDIHLPVPNTCRDQNSANLWSFKMVAVREGSVSGYGARCVRGGGDLRYSETSRKLTTVNFRRVVYSRARRRRRSLMIRQMTRRMTLTYCRYHRRLVN